MVIPIHPAVLEEFRARREMRMALVESFHLLPEVERLEAEYLRSYGTPAADQLFVAWERAYLAAEANCALRDKLAARCKVADDAFDALPVAVRWAWMDAAITA